MTPRWRWSPAGAPRPGAHPVFDAHRGGRRRRKGRDRRRRRAVRGAGADRRTSPWRRAICATCCAPAARPRRRPSPSPGSPRSRGRSRLALCRRRLAADRRSALAVAGGRRAAGRRLRHRRRAARRSTRWPRRLRGLHLDLHQPLEQSVRGGTQTDGPLFARIEPEIRALRAAIVAAVERHIAQLPPPRGRPPEPLRPKRAPVRFAGSWSVRLAGAGFHANHIHPAGWISSAFYVALPAMDRGPRGLAEARRAAGRTGPRPRALPP